MAPLPILAFTATTALGRGVEAQKAALIEQRSGLRPNTFGPEDTDGAPLRCWTGRVEGLEEAALPEQWSQWECRNNRLAWMAMQQDGLLDQLQALVQRHGA